MEAKQYKGSCHCGAVSYHVTTNLEPVITCNCSICSRSGSMLTFVGEPQFELLTGADNLTDYLFNRHAIHHLFCKTCGVKSFARGKRPDGGAMVAINVRCLEGVDLDSLKTTSFDGLHKL